MWIITLGRSSRASRSQRSWYWHPVIAWRPTARRSPLGDPPIDTGQPQSGRTADHAEELNIQPTIKVRQVGRCASSFTRLGATALPWLKEEFMPELKLGNCRIASLSRLPSWPAHAGQEAHSYAEHTARLRETKRSAI